MRLVDAILPGFRTIRERPAGWLAAGAWLAMWGLVAIRFDRVTGTLVGGAWDDWVALAAILATLWLAQVYGGVGRPPSESRPPGQWALAWDAFRRHRPAMLGLTLVGALALIALLTPYLAPHDPAAQALDIVAGRFRPPTWEHPMGTDEFGRDVLSRVLYGGRVSLAIGTLAILIAVSLGSLVGSLAGYVRGWVDAVAMRTVDLLLSFPRLVLLITIVAFVTPSVFLITVVLGLTGWMATSRLVRGEVLSLREREFVQAARALGLSRSRILLRHVLPNAAGPIIVAATLGIGNTILVEASLSFLGMGVPPPAPTWGGMVADGKEALLTAPWITLFPGLAIVLTVMSFNLVGDGLRDALDPRALDRGGR